MVPYSMPAHRVPLVDRLSAKYAINSDTGCWDWTGHTDKDGYGSIRVTWESKTGRPFNIRAHRAMWETSVGPIPDGFVLDHLCFNKRCVNPDHLEPVTWAENASRWSQHYRQAHPVCPQGHEFTPENTIYANGRRMCRECGRGNTMVWYYRTRANLDGANSKNRTHCKRGHERTSENTYVAPDGRRRCRVCKTNQAKVSA